MKRILTLIALCIVSGVSASTRQLQIIPQPVKAELRTGVFVTASNGKVSTSGPKIWLR